jgi:hypothetical protein
MRRNAAVALVILSLASTPNSFANMMQDQEPYVYGSQSSTKKIGLQLKNQQTMNLAKRLVGVWNGKNASGNISVTLQFWIETDKLVGTITDQYLTNVSMLNLRLSNGTLFFTTEKEVEQGGYLMKIVNDSEVSIQKVFDTSQMLSEDEKAANKIMGEYRLKLKKSN